MAVKQISKKLISNKQFFDTLFLNKLPREFYLQNSLKTARQLIGKVLARKISRRIYAGIIVETEAYLGSKDPASHAYNGKTKRNEFMFEEGGRVYVYFTYGNHYCINAVTGKKGIAGAVLIRAVEPVAGIEFMKINRSTENLYNLASGPGKLTQAMEITSELNGRDFTGNEIFIAVPAEKLKYKINSSKRIGITKNPDKLYRYYAAGNQFVSGFRKSKKNN